MYFYEVREISPTEYHVIETRFENEPEFILARCSGVVPAYDIVKAMRLAQSIKENGDTIHNALFSINEALENYKFYIKTKSF